MQSSDNFHYGTEDGSPPAPETAKPAVFLSFSAIRTNREHYARCHEILGLPDSVEWSDIRIEFGLDDPGRVILTLIPTGEQVRDLAELAINPVPDR